MFIREIVMEGFKSYGKRTIVHDVDPHFNAITGMNGSGKSNLLDAVCFVLGISNLREVRAVSLKDLIHVGSTGSRDRAVVSVIFDNNDKGSSPIGYEDFDTITISRQIFDGGRVKCLINGTLAPASRIADLFHSIHMNVNNPHFIVMQGRITRVLSMKAVEILSMIEEATGSKMYDESRARAISHINKKRQHYLENENLIKEALIPLLEKIKSSREEYKRFCDAKMELERLEKEQVAYTYLSIQERIEEESKLAERLEMEISSLKDSISKCAEECKRLRSEVEAFRKERETEEDEETRALQTELDERTKKEEAAADKYRVCLERWKQEMDKLADLEKRVADGEVEKGAKQEHLERLTAELRAAKAAHDDASEMLRKAKEFCDIIDCGMAISAEGRASTLVTRLSAAKDERRNIELKESNLTCRVNILENDVKSKEAVVAEDRANYNRITSMLRRATKEFTDVQNAIASLNYEENAIEQCSQELRVSSDEVKRLEHRTATLEAKFPSTNFDYALPEPNFDRNRVLGTVANLIRLKDARVAAAIEMIAGHKVGKDNCDLAVNFLDFDAKVEKAISFVFGRHLVCPTPEIAEQVAFHPGIMQLAMTYDGDEFNPGGSICGGSKPSRGYLLELRTANRSLYDELFAARDRAHELRNRLDEVKIARERYHQLYDQMKRAQTDKEQLEQAVEESRTTACNKLIAEARAEIESLNAELASLKARKERAIAEAEEIERILNNGASNKEAELKKAAKAREASEKEEAAKRRLLEEKEQEFYSIEGDVKVLDDMIVESNKEIEALRSLIAQMDEEKSREKAVVEKLEAASKVVKDALLARRGAQDALDEEMERKSSEASNLQRRAQQEELKVRELEHEKKRALSNLDECQQKMKKYVTTHSWIEAEKHKFGQPGTEFPHGSSALERVEREIAAIRSTIKPVHSQAKRKHVDLYEGLSAKLRVIEEKREKCEKDKEEILKVLKVMQEKKRNALEIAVMQVNRDFDAIMSMMLPNVNVKLVPVDPNDILKGLDIKVAFTGQWLDSLTELSGGQRSLVALALIFAMLLFKPAPVYILDEIDAALDIVHTERIGEMIREKFPHSQFLVVSLKEGMFSNANVIYRTRLENGQSYITRTTGSKYRPMSREAIAAIRKQHQKEEEFRAAVRTKLANIRSDIGIIELNSSFGSATRNGASP